MPPPVCYLFFHTHIIAIHTSVSFIKYSLYSYAYNASLFSGAFLVELVSFLLCSFSISLFISQWTCSSNCGPLVHSLYAWEPVKNIESQALPQTYWITVCILRKSTGDSYAHKCLGCVTRDDIIRDLDLCLLHWTLSYSRWELCILFLNPLTKCQYMLSAYSM